MVIFRDKVKNSKSPIPIPKNPHIFYKSHQVLVKYLLKIVINVHENMKLFTYEVYHNFQYIQFKLEEQYAYHSVEAIHESVVSNKAIGIDCGFKNNSLSPSFNFNDCFY